MLPTSRALCRVACDSAQPLLLRRTAAVREQAKARNASLRERYEAGRRDFQREQKERGGLSSFERSMELMLAEDAQRESLLKLEAQAAKQQQRHESPRGRFSLSVPT